MAPAWAWLVLAVPIALVLTRITAPYGRHTRSGWGPTVPARLGWVLMELPSPLLVLAFFLAGEGWQRPMSTALASLWWLHYANRAVLYPLRMRGGGRPMPLSVIGMGLVFNLVNAGLNGEWLFFSSAYAPSWATDPRLLAGVLLFAVGLAINQHSDAVLRALRGRGTRGYRVPQSGLHRYVAAPNYLGECLEWTGWALATWSIAGASFALWTWANLAPRALAHLRWYKSEFPDYPSERKALIPWVL